MIALPSRISDDISLAYLRNAEAESGVIGAMLLDNNCIDEVITIIRPGDFFSDQMEIMCREIFSIHGEGKPVDSVILSERLIAAGTWDKIGGMETLAEVMEVPHSANAGFHAQIVRQKSVGRKLTAACNDTIAEVTKMMHSAEDLQARAETRMFAVNDEFPTGNLVTVSDAVTDTINELLNRKTQGPPGIKTGLYDLDRIIGGFCESQFIIIAARPSVGKSSLARQIAQHAALTEPSPTLLFSMEMTKGEICEQMLSGASGIDSGRIRAGQLSPTELAEIKYAAESFKAMKLHIDDSPTQSLSRIGAIARRMKRQSGLAMVVIDYAQLLDMEADPRARESRQEQVAKLSRRCKILAGELKVPLVMLSQLNRGPETREDQIPRISDLRETGAWEQDANMIILLHRQDMKDENNRPGEVDALVGKNRGGPTGKATLTFRKSLTRFENFAPPGVFTPPPPTKYKNNPVLETSPF